jgi:hypothetical protein
VRAAETDLVPGDRSRNTLRLVDGRRLDAEGVGKPDEQAEQCSHIGGFGDLLVTPAGIAKPLHLLVGDAVRRLGYGAGEVEQQSFGGIEAGCVEVTVAKRIRHSLELFALQLQEPRV